MPAASNDIGVTRLGQIAIRVHDVDRAVAFYRDILGLPLLFTAGKLAFFNWAACALCWTFQKNRSSTTRAQFCISSFQILLPHTVG